VIFLCTIRLRVQLEAKSEVVQTITTRQRATAPSSGRLPPLSGLQGFTLGLTLDAQSLCQRPSAIIKRSLASKAHSPVSDTENVHRKRSQRAMRIEIRYKRIMADLNRISCQVYT
jgi:hypothetical protein